MTPPPQQTADCQGRRKPFKKGRDLQPTWLGMNLSHSPYSALRQGSGIRSMYKQSAEHWCQLESVVETVGEGAQVVFRALAELEGLVAAADHCLQVSQDGVVPPKGGISRGLRLPTTM